MALTRRHVWLWSLLLLHVTGAQAELRLNIDSGAGLGVPLLVLAQPERAHPLAAVVDADLGRSGFFRMLDPSTAPTKGLQGQGLAWDAWDGHDAAYVAVLTLKPVQNERLQLEVRLFDPLVRKSILALRMSAGVQQSRRLAHQVADALHKEITGVSGAFDTRIAYVSLTRAAGGAMLYRLFVADADGHKPVAILSSPQPLLSPVWSPDGTTLAYVSFEGKRPRVFLQNLRNASRRAVPGGVGRSSSAPAFSPDGRQLALAMAVDGDMEIHLHTLATDDLQRFTHSTGIDTEPAWTADGQAMIFTSDRSGKPRLYRQGLREIVAQALPIAGDYASDASPSSDGRYLAFVQSTEDGGYGIVLYEPESESLFPLSSGTLDEAPSFAPNGFSLIYASTLASGEKVLMLASHNGKIRQRLGLEHRDVREPAWSPYRR